MDPHRISTWFWSLSAAAGLALTLPDTPALAEVKEPPALRQPGEPEGEAARPSIAFLEVVPEIYEGRVLLAGPEQLIVAVNGDHHMFSVGADAKITRDGQPAKLADLVKQDLVRIAAEEDGETLTVIAIEARSSH